MGTRLPHPARAWALGAALACALSAPAHASDLRTVNNTDAYVDPAIASEFVTVPNLCTEPIGSQGTSVQGCAELGARAVLAIQGASPYGDVYWEPDGSYLQATNAFVPGNEGSHVGDTGYAPLFSDHKYDLFGSPTDTMGKLNRREILFMEQIPTSGGGITVGQTTPGEDTVLAMVIALLIQPEGATVAAGLGGHDFDYADMELYTHVTGFTTGKLATVTAWCNANFGAAFCGAVTTDIMGLLYAVVHFPEINTVTCGTAQNGLVNETNCKNRDQWVDQVVASYTEAWESLGGDRHFAENFRSQVGYDPNALILDSGTSVWADFRLEQSAELSGPFTTAASDPGDALTPGDNLDGIAGRQTFQQAMRTISGPLGGLVVDTGQMVSQDVQGYFMSCLNCDGPTTHAFAPAKQDLVFMPYDSGWSEVPTITHGGEPL